MFRSLQHFLRDGFSACKQMQSASLSPRDGGAKALSEDTPTEVPRSPGHAANLLRVPSLATSRSEGSGENKRPDTPEMYQQWRYHTKEEYSRPNHQYYDVYHGNPYGWSYPTSVVPHPEDPSFSSRHYHQSHSVFRHGGSCPSPYDSRYPFRPHPDSYGAKAQPPTAPNSIRSGRGGGRVGIHNSNSHVRNKRTSFPVSQRGKGSRGALCRTPPRPTCERLKGMEEPGSATSIGIHSGSIEARDNNARLSSSSLECDTIGRKSKKTMLLERSLASDLNSK